MALCSVTTEIDDNDDNHEQDLGNHHRPNKENINKKLQIIQYVQQLKNK